MNQEVFMPKDTLDQPCDVVLVDGDGKEFKAHRKVLSEASPFFEKLLNSDMKESKEGVVRLEVFSGTVMAATLEFIYTGHVPQILAEDNARELIIMADYLNIQKLKSLAEEILAPMLNASNFMSIYNISESLQCEELFFKTKEFILTNFTALSTGTWSREDVKDILKNMSSKEMKMWISSDKINVSAEEDVFKIILAWINHDKSKRQKYFAELFRHVRLVYVSRDFLIDNVVTNELVKDNEGRLDLVKDVIDSIDSKKCENLSVPPRKSLETPAIVMRMDADFVCYFPDEETWCRLGRIPFKYEFDKISSCNEKLYGHSSCNFEFRSSEIWQLVVSFKPYSNAWKRILPLKEDRWSFRIIAKSESEMYALRSERCYFCTSEFPCGREHSKSISKYQPKTLSWEDILDRLYPYVRKGVCIVASEHFIYFIGGLKSRVVCLSDVDRYNFSKGRWDKVADIQLARSDAQGAAANGKIFIAGGNYKRQQPLYDAPFEVYDETTNEWQFIAIIDKPEAVLHSLLAADGKVYAVCCEPPSLAAECDSRQISVECYNPEKDEWEMKTETAFPVNKFPLTICVIRIFKGLSHIRPLETSTSDSLSAATTTQTS